MAEIFGASLFAFSGALLIVLVLARWGRLAPTEAAVVAGPVVFLFDGESLVDATGAAGRLLRGRRSGGSDLAALLGMLAKGFGADLPARLAALPESERLLLAAEDGEGSLEAERDGGSLRVTLRLDEAEAATLERLSHEAAREELALLRGLAESAPQPIWVQDAAGAVTWANRAYLALADLLTETPGRRPRSRRHVLWPGAPLFEPPGELAEGVAQSRRLALGRPGPEGPAWFDVVSVRRGPGTLHIAAEVTGLVQAEAARMHFVQALTRTFADLATGLAVFDRQRRLAVFNPAFLDLTGLPAEVLSARPTVQEVLDHLREAQALPEPSDYRAWRDELATLEAQASEGTYSDVWTLPSGRNLRVTGRPHPDGALAFLFEDISDVLEDTRRLRAELATVRAALGALDGAVALFGPGGARLLSNAAYVALWGALPGSDGGLASEGARWRLSCKPGAAWEGLDHALAARSGWSGEVRHRDGRTLRLRVAGLPGGATLVSFAPGPADPPQGQAQRPGRRGAAARHARAAAEQT